MARTWFDWTERPDGAQTLLSDKRSYKIGCGEREAHKSSYPAEWPEKF